MPLQELELVSAKRLDELIAELKSKGDYRQGQGLYDQIAYAQAGQTNLAFFGRSQSGSGIEITNLKTAGKTPKEVDQIVKGVRLFPLPAGNLDDDPLDYANDVHKMLKKGALTVKIAEKEICPAVSPLRKVNGGLDAFAAFARIAAGGADVSMSYAEGKNGKALDFAVPYGVPGDTSLDAQVNWAAAVAVSAAGALQIELIGSQLFHG